MQVYSPNSGETLFQSTLYEHCIVYGSYLYHAVLPYTIMPYAKRAITILGNGKENLVEVEGSSLRSGSIEVHEVHSRYCEGEKN